MTWWIKKKLYVVQNSVIKYKTYYTLAVSVRATYFMSEKARVFITITETLLKRLKITGIQWFSYKSTYSITLKQILEAKTGFSIFVFSQSSMGAFSFFLFLTLLWYNFYTIQFIHLNVCYSMVLVYLQSCIHHHNST